MDRRQSLEVRDRRLAGWPVSKTAKVCQEQTGSEPVRQAGRKSWSVMRATENNLAMGECGAGVYILGLIAVVAW